jgi:hypothetical protein
MPDLGFYRDRPRPEAIDALKDALESHGKVEDVELEKPQTLHIRRRNRSTLKIFLTNTYIVGEAEASAILAKNSDVNAIVTMGAWNSYTYAARSFCSDRGVGLFTFGELLGAIHYEGTRFTNYTPPSDEEREARRRRYRR